MATVNITGSIVDVVGGAAAGARLTFRSVLSGWSNGDALVLGEPFVVTADGSGDVDFDAEPGEYQIVYQLSTGEKVLGASIGPDAGQTLASIINTTTAQALTSIMQTVLGYKDDAEAAAVATAEDALATAADRAAAASSAAQALSFKSQAELAAIAAGAPIVATLTTPTPADGTVELIAFAPGFFVYQVVSGAWSDPAYLGPLSFADRTAPIAALIALLPDGTVAEMAGLKYIVDSAATGTASATDDLGVDGLRPLGGVQSGHTGGDITAAKAFGPVKVSTDPSASPITLAANDALFGDGRRETTLTFAAGTGTAINTPDVSTARNSVSGVRILSDGLTKTTGDVGIDGGDSSFGLWYDYSILGFDIGFIDNAVPNVSSFSARHIHMAYEINTCNTGFLHWGANANSWLGGRVWNCLIGHDLDDAEALSFFAENTESCGIAYKIRNSKEINLFGGYIEAGVGSNVALDLDEYSMIGLYGVNINGKRGWTEEWNPNESEWHLDALDTNKSQARITFFADASKQYIRNSDFSLPLSEGWLTSGVTATFDTTAFESGTRSLKLVPSSTTGYLRQLFPVERDVRHLAYGVRVMPTGNQTITFYCSDGVNTANPSWAIPAYAAWATATDYEIGDVVTNGGYSYRAVAAHTSGATFVGDAAHWKFNWLTFVPAFPLGNSAANMDVRIYPDTVGGAAPIYVDQKWGVRGRFTSAPRRYDQRLIYLKTPITLASGAVTANTNTAYTLAGVGADIPTGAVGYIVRLKAKGSAAATYPCAINLFAADVGAHPRLNNFNATLETVINNLSGDTVQAFPGSGSNTLTYEAKLIGWVVE